MKTFVVTKGIFEGTIFNGETKDGRVYNRDTAGQSYPLDNCIVFDPLVEILLREGELRLKGIEKTYSTILDFCHFDFVKWYFKIDFKEANSRKEVIAQMMNYINNEGFAKYTALLQN